MIKKLDEEDYYLYYTKEINDKINEIIEELNKINGV